MDTLFNFYEQMFVIRSVEEGLLKAFSSGLLTGTTHVSIGQEAGCVGVINALDRSKDIIFSNHRCHGHFLAYCGDVDGLLGELMGKSSGVCKGIGGSQHLCKNNFYSNGILGGTIPVALGCAMAEKRKRTQAVVVVFIGDGTLGEGVAYESFNIASLWGLPLLIIQEDNKIAQSTPSRLEHAGETIQKVRSFGIQTDELEANDVMNVFHAAQSAVEYVRTQLKPYFIRLHTYRLAAHSKGDDTRPVQEINELLAHDPLIKLREQLINNKFDVLELENKIKDKIQQSFERTKTHGQVDLEYYKQTMAYKERLS